MNQLFMQQLLIKSLQSARNLLESRGQMCPSQGGPNPHGAPGLSWHVTLPVTIPLCSQSFYFCSLFNPFSFALNIFLSNFIYILLIPGASFSYSSVPLLFLTICSLISPSMFFRKVSDPMLDTFDEMCLLARIRKRKLLQCHFLSPVLELSGIIHLGWGQGIYNFNKPVDDF